MSHSKHSISMRGRKRLKLKTLAGFEKHHRIPVGDEEAAERYLANIGVQDVGRDLDIFFKKLRDEFRYKRRELEVAGPIDGTGSIQSPDFEYRVHLRPDKESPESVIWERSVVGLSSWKILLTEAFQKIFDPYLSSILIELSDPIDTFAVIDHVEDLAESDCEVDYDREGTWCDIRTSDLDAKMRIMPHQILVDGPLSLSTADLIENYWQLQSRFLATVDLPEWCTKA